VRERERWFGGTLEGVGLRVGGGGGGNGGNLTRIRIPAIIVQISGTRSWLLYLVDRSFGNVHNRFTSPSFSLDRTHTHAYVEDA
jgi:hypothetical protein